MASWLGLLIHQQSLGNLMFWSAIAATVLHNKLHDYRAERHRVSSYIDGCVVSGVYRASSKSHDKCLLEILTYLGNCADLAVKGQGM